MDMGIDQAGHQPLAADVDDAGVCGNRHGSWGADGGDLHSIDDDHGILERRGAGAVDQGSADQGRDGCVGRVAV